MISAAGSVDSAAMFSAAVAAVGPIGAAYLAGYGPAQTLVGGVHAAIGAATHAADTSFIAADNARRGVVMVVRGATFRLRRKGRL